MFECAKCGLMPTEEGHDGCLGTLKGNIMNACCGHDDDRLAYIQYWDRSDIRGNDAVKEQKRLLSDENKHRASKIVESWPDWKKNVTLTKYLKKSCTISKKAIYCIHQLEKGAGQ